MIILYQLGLVIPLVSDTADNNFVISLGYNRSKDFNRILKFNGFNSENSSLIQDLTSINNYIPRDLLLSYPEFDPGSNAYLGDRTIFNGNLNQEGYVLEEGGINHWSFGIAGELAYNIFFGASFNYNVGNYLRDGEYTESDSRNSYADSLRTIATDPLTAGFHLTGFDEPGRLPGELGPLLVEAAAGRRDDAWALLSDVDQSAQREYGTPAYSPLAMPGWISMRS